MMDKETIESINKSTDITYLSLIEEKINDNISSLLNRDDMDTVLYKQLTKEANTYGITSLDEYIKFKIKFYLSLKESCINRLIDLNRNTECACGTCSIAI